MKNITHHSFIISFAMITTHIVNNGSIQNDKKQYDDYHMYIARNTSELGVLAQELGIDLKHIVSFLSSHDTKRKRQTLSLIFWICTYAHTDSASSDELSALINWCLYKLDDDFFAEILDEQSFQTKKSIKDFLFFEWGDTEREQYQNLSQKYPKVANILKQNL